MGIAKPALIVYHFVLRLRRKGNPEAGWPVTFGWGVLGDEGSSVCVASGRSAAELLSLALPSGTGNVAE